jgi:mannose-6-phosphate isomerase class I
MSTFRNEKANFTFYLDSVNVKEGDVFFLETGTVHAIERLLVAEIQQTSDITHIVSMILIESMRKGIQENFM